RGGGGEGGGKAPRGAGRLGGGGRRGGVVIPDPEGAGAALKARPRHRPRLWRGLRRGAGHGGRGHRLSLRDQLRRYRGGRAGCDRGVMRTSWLASCASLLTLRSSSGIG